MKKVITAIFTILLVPLWATTFVVNNLLDTGPGSFRNAIQAANLSSGCDTISFSVSDTICLTSSESSNSLILPQVSDSLIIMGNNAILKAAVPGRHLQISAPCEISDLTFIDGSALLTGGALRLLASAVIVRLNRCRFIGNNAPESGGGLHSDCPLELQECFFEANSSAHGGGIAIKVGILPVSMVIDNCTFKDNTASTQGGAVHLEGGTLQLQTASFEDTIGPFDQSIFIGTGTSTATVEMLPGFELLPVPAGLSIDL